MVSRRTVYVALALVFGASAFFFVLLPRSGFVQEFAAVPLPNSLVAAVVQIIRD